MIIGLLGKPYDVKQAKNSLIKNRFKFESNEQGVERLKGQDG